MDIEEKLLTDLKDDFLYQIVINLSIKDIFQLMQVNKRLRSFIQHSEFWNIYFLYNKHSYRIKNNNLLSTEMIRYLRSLELLQTNYEREIGLESLYSTTQDNQQSIFETLNDDSSLFWSSTGVKGPDDRDEVLIYRVHNGYGYINQFSIKFFFANYLQTKLYPCKRIRFEAGMSSDKMSFCQDFICDLEYNPNSLDYTASYKLKQIVQAKIVKITLGGRVGLQETDNQYYIAVERFKILGVPISRLDLDEDQEILEEYVDDKVKKEMKEGQNKAELEALSLKYLKIIVKLTNEVAFFQAKNSFQSEESLFSRFIQQREEAKQFKESQDLSLFEKYPELRANLCVYEHIMKDPFLMQKYLENRVNQTFQLSELESFVVVTQKINFYLLSKILITVTEVYKQTDQNEKQVDEFGKIICQYLMFTLKYNVLPYEKILTEIDYFSDSFSFYYQLIERLTDYLNIPEDTLQEAIAHLNDTLRGGKKIQLHQIHKQALFRYLQQKIIPFCFFSTLKTFYKAPIANITPKQNLFTQPQQMHEDQALPVFPKAITQENVESSKRATRLMIEQSFKTKEEVMKQDEQMLQEAKEFIEKRDIQLIQGKEKFLNNTYVFEIIMNTPNLFNQYFEGIAKEKHKLNPLESISVFVQQINYKLIVQFLDLFFDLTNQEEMRKVSLQAKADYKSTLCKLIHLTFAKNLKLKELPNSEMFKQFTYTKSFSIFYHFVKPLQNFMIIPEEDIEIMVHNIKQKLTFGTKQESKSLSYSEYKKYIETVMFDSPIMEIFEFFLNKYEQMPQLIKHI